MTATASVEDLKEALRENLEASGTMRAIKAKMRASILKAINNDVGTEVTHSDKCKENLIINELLREYLIFNNLRETLSVFIPVALIEFANMDAESGAPEIRPFDRSFLCQHLRMEDGPNSTQLPLLYSLVAARTLAQSE
ncbi:hypothetical protein CEUSTIGMA_g7625.t1 [Chlamydomonas eustigma]|uniref:LisH domain-containing protein n=1 Tax=Chlamydomonas eustigma TaxID=1157962 RepID=A0A250XAT4_9CHLO|nr:hypothetical protein CEUSTIGMA_g7625.t1 [Chlamydomonas eustigma]|eukprot:GAX80187.1 hypothetical protein CEUSTIGMA_g7625.t1 [Chlamydomonas eustigma]